MTTIEEVIARYIQRVLDCVVTIILDETAALAAEERMVKISAAFASISKLRPWTGEFNEAAVRKHFEAEFPNSVDGVDSAGDIMYFILNSFFICFTTEQQKYLANSYRSCQASVRKTLEVSNLETYSENDNRSVEVAFSLLYRVPAEAIVNALLKAATIIKQTSESSAESKG